MMRPSKHAGRRFALPPHPSVCPTGWTAGQVRTMCDTAGVEKMTKSIKSFAPGVRLLKADVLWGTGSVTGLMPLQQTIAKKVQNRP